jgi:hypothetical protein
MSATPKQSNPTDTRPWARRLLGAGVPRPGGGDPTPELFGQDVVGLPAMGGEVSGLRTEPTNGGAGRAGGAGIPVRLGRSTRRGGVHSEPGVWGS